MNDDFEQHLSQQSPRSIPDDWRTEILATATAASATRAASPSGFGFRISSLLWPSPYAWGSLAAAWVLILAVNLSSDEKPLALAQASAPPSREILVALHQQQLLYAELLGVKEPPAIDRPKPKATLPRSERALDFSLA